MKRFIKNKKPILFCIGFLFLAVLAKAQDLSRARALLEQKEYAMAREAIDSFISVDPVSAEAWLLKSHIYTAMGNDATARYLVADARQDAFQSLQKAVQLNMGYVNSQLRPENYRIAFELYDGFTNDGLNLFNAGVERNDKNSYKDALTSFKKAGQVSGFIYRNGWGLPAIDTVNLYYTSLSAINADKEEDAEFYAKKIVDNNITTAGLQTNLESVYQWLAYHFKTKQDSVNFNRYATAGAKAFPVSDYFILSYIDWYRQQKNYTELFKQYQQLLKTGDVNQQYRLAYYKDMYNFLYQNKPDTTASKQYQEELARGLTAYLQQNKSNTDARLLLGKFYINRATDQYRQAAALQFKYIKLATKYRNSANSYIKRSNQYLLNVVNKYAAISRSNYQEALELLINNFRKLNMPKEVRKYQLLLSKSMAIACIALIFFLLLLNIILIIGILIFNCDAIKYTSLQAEPLKHL